jgi:formylglycine-generating enzyme required for sulfatase activity
VAANSTLDIHTEPDFAAPVIATAARHTRFPVIGQITLDAQVWYQVALADGRTGWLPGIGGAYLDVHWRQVVETFDGVEMVRVPAGCFLMGSASEEPDEAPVHTQCFDEPFWIDRYAVSNRQYGSEGYFRGDSRPRESVDWFDAAAHCAGRDARLPTEAEWEYAARGPLALVYPWGNSFVDDYVISSWRTTARQTEAVGSHPEGASWVGAYNMSGNVWEWTASLYDEYPYDPGDGREDPDDRSGLRVVRGGACCSYVIADVRAAFRFAVDPHTVDANIGFRCARDAEIATG